MGHATNLTHLNLRNNKLQHIAFHCPYLEELDLGHNEIANIAPIDIVEMVNLHIVRLDHNVMTEDIAGVVAYMPNVVHLDLEAFSVNDVQPTASLPKLQLLNLNNVKLSGFPDLPDSPVLHTLILRRTTQMKSIPSSLLRQLTGLKTLDLSESKLETFPDMHTLLSLTQLQNLNLHHTDVEAIPDMRCLADVVGVIVNIDRCALEKNVDNLCWMWPYPSSNIILMSSDILQWIDDHCASWMKLPPICIGMDKTLGSKDRS